jgi:circadian clock protein KaiC
VSGTSERSTSSSSITLLSTGIAGLDDILAGGLPARRLYLVDGAPGTGKTTLALQFLLAGTARGESGLYVTLSESQEELGQVAASPGWSLDGIDIVELPTEYTETDRE